MLQDNELLIVDGACGTNLQLMDIPDAAWDGNEGCNEYLNVSAPEVIVELHASFVEAGAHIIESNTFGATSIVLGEYGLEGRVAEINAAAVANARQAIGEAPCYVAGAIGPTTKLPALGHIGCDELAESYREQIHTLLDSGVDLLLIETCQDLLQLKVALVTAFETMDALSREVPVMASVTFERTGTMLVGTDVAAVVATLEPYPLFSLGLNCATGPEDMMSHIRYLHHNWPGRISCIPNQGLPEVVDGQTVYPLMPEEYSRHMCRFVEEFGVSIVGGCCGTSPDHTKALVAAVEGVTPCKRTVVL